MSGSRRCRSAASCSSSAACSCCSAARDAPSAPPSTQACATADLAASIASLCGEVFEAREFAEERQAHGADRPVALLADDDFGDALVLRVGVVNLVTIDEQDHVCILLNLSLIHISEP